MQRAEPLRVGDRVTAEALVAGVLGNMAALEAVLAEEAAYVREGRLQEGVAAAEPKAALAAAYMQGLEVAKANAVALKRFHPEGVEALRTKDLADHAGGVRTDRGGVVVEQIGLRGPVGLVGGDEPVQLRAGLDLCDVHLDARLQLVAGFVLAVDRRHDLGDHVLRDGAPHGQE